MLHEILHQIIFILPTSKSLILDSLIWSSTTVAETQCLHSIPDTKGQQGQFKDKFLYYSIELYAVTPYYNCLAETVIHRGNNRFLLRNKENYTTVYLEHYFRAPGKRGIDY